MQVIRGAQATAKALLTVFNAERSRHPGTSSALTEAIAPQNMPLDARGAFRLVFGKVTFRRIEGNTIDGWAETHLDWVGNGCNVGEICYDQSIFTDNGPQSFQRWGGYNVVHELGHGLDQRGGRRGRADLAAEWVANPNFPRRDALNQDPRGYAGLYFGWQQTRVRTQGEEFADMFVGWVYGQWEASVAGATRSSWMRANMSRWIALAVEGN